MPELPEVQTTVNGINEVLKGLLIKDVWTSYGSPFHLGKKNIKDKKYFGYFKKEIIGAKIKNAERKGKNILINLSNAKTILIHMKMTGHLMYGKYELKNPDRKLEEWVPAKSESEALKDPFNKFIRLVFIFSNGKHLAFSDMRKFAKVLVWSTEDLHCHSDLECLGPDPLSSSFTYDIFKKQIGKRQTGKIKQVLMDQTLIAGIGNIYSDEILFEAGVHPASIVKKIPEEFLKKIFRFIKPLLEKGIDFGGDSTSDYRNIRGERGTFQHAHNVYRRTGKSCLKKGCRGMIKRLVIGGRSAHFCPLHQEKF
jgi:formamidopyrimidine-DNA glycosylase